MVRGLSEPISGISHVVAGLLSVAGLSLLVTLAALRASVWHVVGFAIFGASLILLYAASATYHLVPLPKEKKAALRRLDHVMIFVLIAGTYTPICLTVLRGPWGWTLFGIVWGMAALGIGLKLAWFNAPRWLSTALYVALGWAALIAVVPLVRTLSLGGLLWLLLGGAFYTVGALFYATKWPTFHARHFTFHELFHMLVVCGSLSHFWLMYQFVLPAA